MRKIARIKYIFVCLSLLLITNSYSQLISNNKDFSRKDSIRLTFELQNKSFILDENGGDIDSSIFYAELALSSWISLRDTVNEANNRKYLGYLYGKKSYYEKGKSEIFKAISLFGLKNNESGVAVSYFDLSKVYGYEKRYDSALLYIDKALDYWQQKADTFRILTNNNQKLYMLIQTKNYKEAKSLQQESEKLLVKKKLHWRPVVDYYYLSIQLNKKIDDKNARKFYERLYSAKVKDLESKGLKLVKFYK
jgi:tetratricopeptide (TPR) repeat protein